MAATHSSQHKGGFISNNPGWIATIFAILVTAGFLGALISSAGDHHAPKHGAAPAAHH